MTTTKTATPKTFESTRRDHVDARTGETIPKGSAAIGWRAGYEWKYVPADQPPTEAELTYEVTKRTSRRRWLSRKAITEAIDQQAETLDPGDAVWGPRAQCTSEERDRFNAAAERIGVSAKALARWSLVYALEAIEAAVPAEA